MPETTRPWTCSMGWARSSTRASCGRRSCRTEKRASRCWRPSASSRWSGSAAAGEAAPLRRRHAAYYLALAEAAEPHLEGPDQGAWAARLEREHDNLRAALAWAREDGDAATGQRLAGALWRFWDARGYLTEGRRWLREVSPPPIVDGAAGPAGPAAQAKVLAGAALLAIEQGDYDAAALLCARSIALARARGERRDLVVGLNAQGRLARERGRYDEAVPSHEAALAIAHEDGNKAGAGGGARGPGDRGVADGRRPPGANARRAESGRLPSAR